NGATAGTQYDQLVVTGTGTVTITASGGFGGARVLGATTFQPGNGTAFTLLDNQTTNTITGTFGNAPNAGTVTIGGKTYTANYNNAAFGNGSNDFVVVAIPRTLTWDGGSPTTNNWTDAANWVGDNVNDRPFAGDSLLFDNTGVLARNTPLNDFAPGTNFGLITFNTTAGSYTLQGNAELLNVISGGITNTQGTNTVALTLS